VKKVAIITLNGYFNHGNRLQNYALQQAIESLGFSVETLIVRNETPQQSVGESEGQKSAQISVNINLVKSLRIWLWKIRNRRNLANLNNERTALFKKFTSDFIHESSITVSEKSIDETYCANFDFFVTGSDQVWNPMYSGGSGLYFLYFVPPHKRIAYAPSFGVSRIPDPLQENYRRWLSEIEHISVRENDGARICKELTGKDVPVVLDPTMLLSADDWQKIIYKQMPVQQGILLTYFLGEVSVEYRKIIQNFANLRNLKIVNLSDIKDKKAYVSGPSQFVGLIRDAQLFCTDSFHGTVFSIIFHTPFVVFKRSASHGSSMFSRLETLLKTFDLEHRVFENLDIEDVFHVDFGHVDDILAIQKKASYQFLAESLGIEEN
jgi:hypothetical protein